MNVFIENNKKSENCFITCSGKEDGVGAQVQAVLSTILVARKFGFTYVHTPFNRIGHNELGDDWEIKWEHFFNLGKDEANINELQSRLIQRVHVTRLKEIVNRPNTLYIVKHCHRFADAYPNGYSSLKDQFIDKYHSFSKESIKSFYEPRKVNVAIHIRRGDVSKEITPRRYTDNFYYKSLLQKALSAINDLGLNASVHLYSQGEVCDFHELKDVHINYHLNECPFTTFYNLTTPDILIMAKSSFSYSAALFSNAIKIYEPFWHKPLKGWIATDWNDIMKEVFFDELKLKKAINKLSI